MCLASAYVQGNVEEGQAMNRPARRSAPTNTEHRWDYEQCCIAPLCNFPENSREDQAKQIRHFATASNEPRAWPLISLNPFSSELELKLESVNALPKVNLPKVNFHSHWTGINNIRAIHNMQRKDRYIDAAYFILQFIIPGLQSAVFAIASPAGKTSRPLGKRRVAQEMPLFG